MSQFYWKGARVGKESERFALFEVLPNPANNYINIISTDDVAGEQVKITDIDGALLFARKQNFAKGQPMKVSIANFPGTMLIVTVVDNDTTQQFTILKE